MKCTSAFLAFLPTEMTPLEGRGVQLCSKSCVFEVRGVGKQLYGHICDPCEGDQSVSVLTV